MKRFWTYRFFWWRWYWLLGILVVGAVASGLVENADHLSDTIPPSQVGLKEVEGEIWAYNNYSYKVVLLVMHLSEKCGCPCQDGPPIFLGPKKRIKMLYPVRQNSLFAFYRVGFSKELCIITKEDIQSSSTN